MQRTLSVVALAVTALMVAGCSGGGDQPSELAPTVEVTGDQPQVTPADDLDQPPEVTAEDTAQLEVVFAEALGKMAADAGIWFYPEGDQSVLSEYMDAIQAPRLSDFPVDQGQLFASAEAQAKYVSQPVGDLGSTVVGLSTDRQLALTAVEAPAGLASVTEAQTLMVIDGFVWRVSQGFYQGGIDRVSVATVVYVIDLATSSVTHVELIGVDVPSTNNAASTRGFTLEAAARVYVADPQVTGWLAVPEAVNGFERAPDATFGGRDGDLFRSSAAVAVYQQSGSDGQWFQFWGMSRVQADRLGVTSQPDDELTVSLLAGAAEDSSIYSSGASGGVLRCGSFGVDGFCAWADPQSIGSITFYDGTTEPGLAGLADLANALRNLLG